MFVSEKVNADFDKRLATALSLIKSYNIRYLEIGIFGSFARGEHKATSDIDICIITDERPSRAISGELREEAEELRIDIIFVTRDYFDHSTDLLSVQLRKDYKKIYEYQQ